MLTLYNYKNRVKKTLNLSIFHFIFFFCASHKHFIQNHRQCVWTCTQMFYFLEPDNIYYIPFQLSIQCRCTIKLSEKCISFIPCMLTNNNRTLTNKVIIFDSSLLICVKTSGIYHTLCTTCVIS